MNDNQVRKEIKDILISRISQLVKDTVDNDLCKYNLSDKVQTDIKQNISVCINLTLSLIL